MIDQIKAVLLMVYSALSGFFLPIHDFIVAIMILLGVNFISGWIEDCLHADGWKWRKAFKAMRECCVLCGIGAFVFVMGHFMHRPNSAVQNNPVPLYQFPVFRGFDEIRGKNTISFRIYCNREE